MLPIEGSGVLSNVYEPLDITLGVGDLENESWVNDCIHYMRMY